jgi:hypothetical protein
MTFMITCGRISGTGFRCRATGVIGI